MTALRSAPGLCALVALAALAPALAQEGASGAKRAPVSIESKTSGMQKLDGFLPLYWDEAEGRVYLEVARLGVEMIHSAGFGAGLGSNDIGMDRGALAGSRIVFFERVGPKLLLVQPNYEFRATTQNPEEVRAVRDAFARSVLWGFPVAAESGGRVLVDATDWIVRDSLNLAPRLAYLECRGLDWETPDRHRRAVRRVGLAAWRRRLETPAEWALRVDMARAIVAGFERAAARSVLRDVGIQRLRVRWGR